MRGLALIALLALAGCDNTKADGYDTFRPEYTLNEVTIRFVDYPNLTELRESAPATTHKSERTLHAWSELYPGQRRCVVHSVPRSAGGDPIWRDHEIEHCRHGRWHQDPVQN